MECKRLPWITNHPEEKVDAEAAQEFGSAYPMGARMMSGHTDLHESLESEPQNL